jgi:hypothetical protein
MPPIDRETGAMVLGRGTWRVLAMLGPPEACLRVAPLPPRLRAAHVPRPALHGLRALSGRGASRHIDATRSPRGVEQGATASASPITVRHRPLRCNQLTTRGRPHKGFWSLLRSWLRPHRGISQEKLPLYLGFFQFVHNACRRGKALLGSLVAALVT